MTTAWWKLERLALIRSRHALALKERALEMDDETDLEDPRERIERARQSLSSLSE